MIFNGNDSHCSGSFVASVVFATKNFRKLKRHDNLIAVKHHALTRALRRHDDRKKTDPVVCSAKKNLLNESSNRVNQFAKKNRSDGSVKSFAVCLTGLRVSLPLAEQASDCSSGEKLSSHEGNATIEQKAKLTIFAYGIYLIRRPFDRSRMNSFWN